MSHINRHILLSGSAGVAVAADSASISAGNELQQSVTKVGRIPPEYPSLGAFIGARSVGEIQEYISRLVAMGYSALYVDEEPSSVVLLAYMSAVAPPQAFLSTGWMIPSPHPLIATSDGRALRELGGDRIEIGVGLHSPVLAQWYGIEWASAMPTSWTICVLCELVSMRPPIKL